MTRPNSFGQQLTVCRNTCLAAAFALLASCGGELPIVQGESLALPSMNDFCADRQRALTGTRMPVTNIVHTDYDAFVLSKPGVRPLETQQYIRYSDTARTQPEMISCKFKTADHIRAEYGAQAAGEAASCAYLNRRTLDAVLAAYGERQRQKLRYRGGTAVLIEADQMVTGGPNWLAPFEMVSVDLAGTLRIRSQSMRSDWTDPRFADTPVRFKGTHYCHLIAPDYLRRLLTTGS
ncbi:MAG TPA: hypothetical protein P5528_16905 [Steroidobacteraceae bacterium]|nr:hypothetical protein [Steroidobacteraceae bacterium]